MYKEIRELRIYRTFEEISDKLWDDIVKWDGFSKFTGGKQLVNAMDSVCANLDEFDGRYHARDKMNYLYFARGSLKEVRGWIARSNRRRLFRTISGDEVLKEIEETLPKLNAFISAQRKWTSQIKEGSAEYF